MATQTGCSWPVSACRAQQRSDTACKMKSRLRHCSTVTARVWPKRCIHAERRGLMQISESRYVLLLSLQSHPRYVKTESTSKCRAFRLAPSISAYRPLKWRTGSAILKSLVREHRAHTVFMSTGHPASMKSSTSVLALRSLRALEVIGSDSDLVAQAT